jgi:hypothetical protein
VANSSSVSTSIGPPRGEKEKEPKALCREKQWKPGNKCGQPKKRDMEQEECAKDSFRPESPPQAPPEAPSGGPPSA